MRLLEFVMCLCYSLRQRCLEHEGHIRTMLIQFVQPRSVICVITRSIYIENVFAFICRYVLIQSHTLPPTAHLLIIYVFILHLISFRSTFQPLTHVTTSTNSLITNYLSYVYNIFSYCGRTTAASTATGSKAQHNKELNHLLESALSI